MTRTGEEALIDWLRRQPDTDLLGNDAAVLPPLPANSSFAVTVDQQIESVHFPSGLAPDRLARRLLAVNLSDLAAMGATPAYAFLALAAPAGFDHRRFFKALLAACRKHDLRLAGGDLAKHPRGITATLTLLGTKEPGSRWLTRDGARPGDALWLGGTVGESAVGRLLMERRARRVGAARRAILRHLEPSPQLALGRWLGTQGAGAALDVSDGVARDLGRLCHASGTGAVIDTEALPLAPGHATLCQSIGVDPLELALGGGEDYVLLFTLPPGLEPPPALGGWRIGTITRSRRLLLRQNGRTRALPDLGWDHLVTSPTKSPAP